MDGGQVALSADGETQFSTWMTDEGGKRRLFFAAVKPGDSPEGSGLVDVQGQQGHPVLAPLTDGRALVVFEANDTIGAALLKADGTVEKKQMLSQRGKFPRLIAIKDAVVVTWENGGEVQTCRIDSTWWAAKAD